MTQTLLRFREVAEALDVSIGKAREIARTDPSFPAVVSLGPRSNRVPAEDFRKYVESKKAPAPHRGAERA
jgi:predicted DNA-binding transcriptional regulator AlpA